MILIMICMLPTVIGKMVIILLMILKNFLVPTLKMMIWKALSLGMIGLQILYPTSDVIVDNSFASKNTFLHVDHDENALCDSYIVEFIHYATENYNERGTHAYIYLN